MKHTSKRLILSALCAAFLGAPAQGFAKSATYTLDPMHTAVTWHIDHFGFSQPSGKFMHAKGTLVLDAENPANAHVEVSIPIAQLTTGVDALDEHLLGADFFDAATYPEATFKSTKVTPTSADEADVEGVLTLRDISKPVTLKVKLNKMGENMFKKQTAGFTASTTIKRSDFGITKYLPGLGDEIRIDIESEANL